MAAVGSFTHINWSSVYMEIINPISTRGGDLPPLLVKNILSPLSHKKMFPDFPTLPKYVLGTPRIIKKIAKKNFLRGAEKILHWGGRSAPPRYFCS